MKSAITITVRLKSTRLPLKALKTICGKTMIEHLIERMKLARLPDMIILCTSTNEQDDPLAEIGKKMGVAVFRGSEDDVLQRLYLAATQNKVDFIVSTTGDNPLTDPEYVDKMITRFTETDADYITALDLPFGTFSYGVKVAAIKKALELKKEKDTEVWGQYFTKSNLFKVGAVEVDAPLKRQELRLTVDTQEDFELMTRVYEALYTKNKNFPLREVIAFLDSHPEVKGMNEKIVQKTPKSINAEQLVREGFFHFLSRDVQENFDQLMKEKKLSMTVLSNNVTKIFQLRFDNKTKLYGELHKTSADAVIVVRGAARYAVGGELVNPRDSDGENVVGDTIKNAEVRTITAGDILIVPKNTPHGFVEVPEEVCYLVVKLK